MKIVKTIAGIIQNENGEILCTQRDISKYPYVSYKWEFPGGKIEEGETDKQTLIRELHEELEIDVEIGELFFQDEYDYPDFHLSMNLYLCKIFSKKLKLNVHLDYKWLKPNEIMSLDWAPADLPVAEFIFKTLKK